MQVMGDWEEITSRLNKTSYHFKKNTEIRSILSNLAHILKKIQIFAIDLDIFYFLSLITLVLFKCNFYIVVWKTHRVFFFYRGLLTPSNIS